MRTKLNFHSTIVSIFTLKNKLFIIFLLLNSILTFAQSSCSADLNVVKNRNSRSASSDGTYFKIALTNKSLTPDTYSLSGINNLSTCTNSDNSSTISNVSLNIIFKDINLNEITKISIQPEETIEFYVNITIPVGTAINKWCCSQISATSSTCSWYKITTDLHTFVINSNND